MRAITTPSRLSYADTIAAITDAIAKSGATLFATIDQTAAAMTVGMALQPTTLLVFGNPKGGTPLMAAHPEVTLVLPLKLVVCELASGVVVIRDKMTIIAPDYGVPADHPALAAMDHSIDSLVASVAA